MQLFVVGLLLGLTLAEESALQALLQRHGGHARLVSRPSRLGGRGLFCTGPLRANSTVLGVPSKLLFGPEAVARLYPDIPRLRDFLEPEEQVAAALARERFARHLRRRRTAWEWLRGFEETDWGAWIASLPQQAVPNAATWQPADAQLAARIFAHLPALRPARQVWGLWTGVTAAQYRWALSIVFSRSFGGYLVPFADFANHAPPDVENPVMLQAIRSVTSFEEAVRWDETVLWTISRDCASGEEVFLDYGARPMLSMEAAFGAEFDGPLMLSANTSARCKALLEEIRGKSAAFKHTFSRAKRELASCAKI
jgi:hypothetical protein